MDEPVYTVEQAKEIVKNTMVEGTVIHSSFLHDGDYLFLATRPDPLEGMYDPFVKVSSTSGELDTFSPQDYDNPRLIIDKLDN